MGVNKRKKSLKEMSPVLRALVELFSPIVKIFVDHGPIPRYPFLYWPYIKFFRPTWIWTRYPGKELPDHTTELMLASPGHCASHSLLKYLKKHNSQRNILLATHAPAPVRYAVKARIPCIVLSRDMHDYVNSSCHHKGDKIGAHAPMVFWVGIVHYSEGFILGKYEEIIRDPRPLIRRVNQKYGTDFNEGDGDMEWIRVYGSTKPKKVMK